jgi:hypothetical protein
VTSPNALLAELWYETAPDLTDPALLAGLRTVSPGAEVQADSIAVPYVAPDGSPAEPDGSGPDGTPRPLLTVVLPGSPLGEGGKTLPDVSQTWDWAEAEDAVRNARASVLVSELFAEGHPARDRAAARTAVVAALSAATSPVGVSWPTSSRVTDPEGPPPEGLGGLLNVRLFTVTDDEDELVMDTLGLAPFGLPDVQCHFRDLAPGAVAAWLFATGSYLFETGDVIDDGDTISGPEGTEHWRCRHEDALVGPARRVIDVDPGEPYAAGRRDRG